MGIQGLIPFLKKATRQANIKEFKGGVVAIDSYCWLHKGAFACAEKLALGEKTDQYVHYCMKFVNSLLSFDVKPIMVFDGCRLPSKNEVEKARRERRNANRKKAAKLLREGKKAEARDCLVQCVDITAEMALELMNACRDRGVDCIVAPYEADAQLAYLNKIGVVDVVITEDSDLVLFGCEKIMFKMDMNGKGMLVEKSKLGLTMDIPADQFTLEKFRRICILSGCDYLASLPGIGLAKATKVFKLSRQSDIEQLIKRIPIVLKMPSLLVPEDYAENFIKAENTFLYQLVYDPLQRKAVPLNPYPPGIDPEDLQYAGPSLSEEMAFQIAIGNINVNNGQKIASFDPDTFRPKSNNFNQSIDEILKQSIWSRGYEKLMEGKRMTACKILESYSKKGDEPIKRPTTKGKEVTVLVPIQNRTSGSANNNGTATGAARSELVIAEEKILPSKKELLSIYSSGKQECDEPAMTDDADQDQNECQTSVSHMKSPKARATEVVHSSTHQTPRSTPRGSAKTPKQHGTLGEFASPTKNIFAVRSEDNSSSGKKRFSLDGCPSTPKSESKCRFFVPSPEPVRESKFFVQLKQVDSAEKVPCKPGADIVNPDNDVELKSSISSRTHGELEKNEIKLRFSAFASKHGKADGLQFKGNARATPGSSKRSLFSSGDESENEYNESAARFVPKKLRLDALQGMSEDRSKKPAHPNSGHRNVFDISKTKEVKGIDDTIETCDPEVHSSPSTKKIQNISQFEPEDPLADITIKGLSHSNMKTYGNQTHTMSASPASSLSDEDPLSEMKSSDKKPPSRKALFSLNDDFYEDERVLSDEGEVEDPLHSIHQSMLDKEKSTSMSMTKKSGPNGANDASNQKKLQENNGGCKPSGLSKRRGRPKVQIAQRQQQEHGTIFKQSNLSNFFRTNFALNKNVEKFPQN